MRAARHLFARELSLAWGGGGGPLLACAFLACLTGVLPLAAGPDPDRLKAVASGMVWTAQPHAESSSVAYAPPCTDPSGL